MTTPKLDELINDPFLQTLSGREHSTPLTLNQVAGLLQVAPETLRKRQRLGQVPPLWEDLRGLFPGLANAPVWRVRLGTMRALLAGVYAPTHAPSVMPTAGRGLPDRQLLDAASAAADGGWHEPLMRGGRRPRHSTFADFLTDSTIPTAESHGVADVWLFMLMGPHKRPVDFFQALDMSVTDDDACVWLTLDEYLTAVRIAAIAVPDESYKNGRAAYLASIPATVPDKERHRP